LFGLHSVSQRSKVLNRVQSTVAQIDLEEPTTLQGVAEATRLGAVTIRNELANEGTSLKQLLARERLRRACLYLRNTDDKIDDIAHRVGYSDRSSLRSRFHQTLRMTPRQYQDIAKALASNMNAT